MLSNFLKYAELVILFEISFELARCGPDFNFDRYYVIFVFTFGMIVTFGNIVIAATPLLRKTKLFEIEMRLSFDFVDFSTRIRSEVELWKKAIGFVFENFASRFLKRKLAIGHCHRKLLSEIAIGKNSNKS